MANRPGPESLQGLLTDLIERIRALETNRWTPERPTFFPDDCLNFFGEGWPDDPYRLGINLSLDPANLLECTEEGLAAIAPSTGWDAVVDSTFVVSVPSKGQFKGIGEALTYLAVTEGKSNVMVLVAANEPAGAFRGNYVETANWTNPARVTLVGIGRGGAADAGPSIRTPRWYHNGFTGGASDFTLTDMYVEAPGSSFNGDALVMVRCGISGLGASTVIAATSAVYVDCYITGAALAGLGGVVWWRGGEWAANITGGPHTIATTSLDMRGIRFGGNLWMTAPLRCYIETGPDRSGGTWTLTVSRALAAGGSLYLSDGASAGGNHNIEALITGGGAATDHTVTLINVGAITTSANTGGKTTILGALGGNGNVDITGPCVIDGHLDIANKIILRGRGVNAKLAVRSTRSAGDTLDMRSLLNSIVTAAWDGSSATGTAKSYVLDASCQNNIVTIAGDTTWPVVGTDAGTANLVTVT